MVQYSPPQSPSRCAFGLKLRAIAMIGLTMAVSMTLLGASVNQTIAQGKGKQGKKPTPVVEAPKRVVVVFPPDVTASTPGEDKFSPDQLTDIVVDVIQSRLKTAGNYRTIFYSRSLPTVKRAINEQTLTAADADKPFSVDDKVKKLALLAGYDMVIVSSIDDYQYNADKNQVSLVMSARLIDFAGGSKVVRAAGESVTSAEAPKTKKQLDVALETARSLTETLVNQLLRTSKPASGDKK